MSFGWRKRKGCVAKVYGYMDTMALWVEVRHIALPRARPSYACHFCAVRSNSTQSTRRRGGVTKARGGAAQAAAMRAYYATCHTLSQPTYVPHRGALHTYI